MMPVKILLNMLQGQFIHDVFYTGFSRSTDDMM